MVLWPFLLPYGATGPPPPQGGERVPPVPESDLRCRGWRAASGVGSRERVPVSAPFLPGLSPVGWAWGSLAGILAGFGFGSILFGFWLDLAWLWLALGLILAGFGFRPSFIRILVGFFFGFWLSFTWNWLDLGSL